MNGQQAYEKIIPLDRSRVGIQRTRVETHEYPTILLLY